MWLVERSYPVSVDGALGLTAAHAHVAVHSHVDGGSFLAAVIEEPAGVLERALDELVGVSEVDRLDAERARRR